MQNTCETRATTKCRFKKSLWNSNGNARRLGYSPCNAPLELLVLTFSGECFGCGDLETGRRLHLDHCHETGDFRGWLCHGCNLAAGYLKESPVRAAQLTSYLNLRIPAARRETVPDLAIQTL